MALKMKISKEEMISAINEGLSIRDIEKRFNCSNMTVRRALEKYGLKTNQCKTGRVCKHCGKELTGSQQYFCSHNCKMNFYYQTKPDMRQRVCHSATQRGFDRKRELVDLLGGGCCVCGYNKNYSSLAFHHKDITTKSFGLAGRNLSDKPWDLLVEEARKCILLCHNCHNELHHPHLDKKLLEENNYIIK